MAAALYIAGPTVVKIGGNTLGYSDNDNLPSITVTDHQHEIKTVLSGAAPEEIVLQGISARISVALVKWDQTVLDNMLILMRNGTANAAISTVGRRVIGQSGYSILHISAVTGTMDYQFDRAWLLPDGMSDSQWGNRERVLTLSFMAIPPTPSSALYTYTP